MLPTPSTHNCCLQDDHKEASLAVHAIRAFRSQATKAILSSGANNGSFVTIFLFALRPFRAVKSQCSYIICL